MNDEHFRTCANCLQPRLSVGHGVCLELCGQCELDATTITEKEIISDWKHSRRPFPTEAN